MRRLMYWCLFAVMIAGAGACGDEAETGDTDAGGIPGPGNDGSVTMDAATGDQDSGSAFDSGSGDLDSGSNEDAGMQDAGGEQDGGSDPDPVLWAQVQPIFQSKCAGGGCHGNNANTEYSQTQATVQGACGGSPRYQCMLNRIKNESMPPAWAVIGGRQRPTASEIELIEAWVEGGAREN